MKISKERLMEIIKEEVSKSFGGDTVSKSDRAKKLRQKVKSSSSEQGVDSRER